MSHLFASVDGSSIRRGPRSRAGLTLTALLALGVAGCGGAPRPSAAVDSPFPDAAELERITRQPLPPAEPRDPPPPVELWRLAGPFPADPDGPPPADAPGAALVLGAATPEAKAAPTAALHCVARELARFVATHGAMPPDDLQGFVGSRCGAPPAGLAAQWIAGDVGPDETPAAVLARWAPGPAEGLAALVGGTPGGLFGGAYAAVDGKAVWLSAAQAAGARLEGYTGLPEADGAVMVRGRARRAFPLMEAVVARGRFGFAACLPELVPGDGFAFRCPVDAADGRARIEVVGFPEGAVLGDRVASVDAWPGGAPVDTWQPPPAVERRPVDDAGQIPEAFAAALNALRAEAGLGALAVDAQQSTALTGLGPYYWSAVDGRIDRGVADQVALGTLAGWQVQGVVQRGHFGAARLWGPRDAGLLLREMLASPSRRRTLFAPGVQALALGPSALGEAETGLLVGTYRRFDAAAFDAPAAGRAARTRLDAQRAVLELERLPAWDAVQARVDGIAAAIGAQSLAPEKALDRALSVAASVGQRGATGLYFETTDLDQVPLPEALRAAEAPPVAVSAGYVAGRGHPWVRHVVLVVWPGQTTTAGGPAPGPVAAGPGGGLDARAR